MHWNRPATRCGTGFFVLRSNIRFLLRCKRFVERIYIFDLQRFDIIIISLLVFDRFLALFRMESSDVRVDLIVFVLWPSSGR